MGCRTGDLIKWRDGEWMSKRPASNRPDEQIRDAQTPDEEERMHLST
jgi:hypothetical protein